MVARKYLPMISDTSLQRIRLLSRDFHFRHGTQEHEQNNAKPKEFSAKTVKTHKKHNMHIWINGKQQDVSVCLMNDMVRISNSQILHVFFSL